MRRFILLTKLQCVQINKNMTYWVPCHVYRGAQRIYAILQGECCVLNKFMSPNQVEKHISYELLFKTLICSSKNGQLPWLYDIHTPQSGELRRERTAKLPQNGDLHPVEETASRSLMDVKHSVLSPAHGKAEHAGIQATNIQDCTESSSQWVGGNHSLFQSRIY